jgi:hypothetical protein
MSYYKTQMMVFGIIDKQIKATLEANGSLKINQMVFDMTRNHPIGAGAVKKRIELYVECNKDRLMILDGEVMLK